MSSSHLAALLRTSAALRKRERFAAVIALQEQVMVRDQTDTNGTPVAMGAGERLENRSDVPG
jgi:hypothetical protein